MFHIKIQYNQEVAKVCMLLCNNGIYTVTISMLGWKSIKQYCRCLSSRSRGESIHFLFLAVVILLMLLLSNDVLSIVVYYVLGKDYNSFPLLIIIEKMLII